MPGLVLIHSTSRNEEERADLGSLEYEHDAAGIGKPRYAAAKAVPSILLAIDVDTNCTDGQWDRRSVRNSFLQRAW